MSPRIENRADESCRGNGDAGWQVCFDGERGGSGGAGAAGSVVGPAGGRPGAFDIVEPGRADERDDRPDDRHAGGWGAPAEACVCFERGGCASGATANRAAWREGGGGPQVRHGHPVRTGRDGLDLAASESGHRTPVRNRHLGLQAQHPAAQKGGFAWRRPRHTLKGRQDEQAVARSGVRLKLLRQQAKAGDIRLFFQDESEALTHPYLAHVWAKRGADVRVEAPGQAKKRAMLGVLDAASNELIVVTSQTKRSTDFVSLLEVLDRRCDPRPGVAARPTVIVLDNGPIHTSKLTAEALGARPWLIVEWLPKYAPELNDIERTWRDLKRHYLANRTFHSLADLDAQIHQAVHDMNQERTNPVWHNLRIAA